jgi:hypothetical protein
MTLRVLGGDQLFDWLQSSAQDRVLRPDGLEKLYPRIYSSVPPGGPYGSPRYLGRWAAKVICDTNNEGLAWTSAAFSRMAKFEMPCFWPTRDIATALRETAPPLESLLDIRWPFEAGAFMMPRGVIADVSWIAYAWLPQGGYPSPLLDAVVDQVLSDRLCIFYCEESTGEWNAWFFDSDANLFEAQQRRDLIAEYSDDESLSTANVSTTDQVTCFLLNMIQLIAARPEMVPPETPQKKQPRGCQTGSPRFWEPRVVGADYHLRREPGEGHSGSHASPRAHWVRGFWREQPWGEGRRLRKTLWIEPFMRGVQPSAQGD